MRRAVVYILLSGSILFGPSCSDSTRSGLRSIELTPASPAVAKGTTQELVATGIYWNSSRHDLTGLVEWSTSASDIATVVGGLSTAHTVGVATITATDPATGTRGAVELIVTPAVLEELSISPPTGQVALGTEKQFVATGLFSDGTVQDLTSSLVWNSADAGRATVSGGLAHGSGVGTVTLSATDPSTEISATASFTVTAAVLTAIDVTPTNPSVALGTAPAFTATGTFSDSSTQDLTANVTWNSGSPAVATVSNAAGSEGRASTLAVGSSVVTATHAGSGVMGSSTLTVTAAVLTSIDVTPPSPSIALGTTRQFVATGTYSDATTQDLTTAVTWSTADAGVATISNAGGSEGLATGVATGTATITAIDPGSAVSGSTVLTVTPAVLASIEVDPAVPSIPLGTNQAFTATGTFTDLTTQDLTDNVTWTSSAPAVATVSNAMGAEGLASSLSMGTTTITATHAGSGISGSTTLTVTPAVLASIALTPTAPSIALGTTQQFTATGTYTDNTVQNITTSVTWSSGTPATATISNAPGTKGLATSVATGATTITATDSGSGIFGSTTLTVTPAVLTAIDVTPATPSIALGTTQQFAATGTYSDGTMQTLTTAVTWSSNDLAVATISNAPGTKGLATSVATGACTITATHAGSGLSDTATLTVTPALLVSIAVTPATPTLPLGNTQQMTATGTYTDASTQDLTDGVTWSSSDPTVAVVSNAMGTEGFLTSLDTGTTTVTATHAGTMISGATTVTISPAVLVSIALTLDGLSVPIGALRQYVATGTYSDATTQDLTSSVTWSSDDIAVATVSNAMGVEGRVTAVSLGSITLTAIHAGSGLSDTTGVDVITQITFRDVDSAASPGALNLSVPTPAGAQTGDVLIAAVAFRPSGAVITPPAGWTLVRRLDNAIGNSNSLAVFRRVAVAAEPANHTWTLSTSTGSSAVMTAYYGVDPWSPVNVENGQSTPSALSHAAPSVATTRNGTMLVSAHAFSSSAAWTPPAGMTEAGEAASLGVPNAAGVSIEANYEFQAVAGATGAKTATASNDSDTGNAHILSLSPGP